jgi:hypothetical protein
VFIIIIIIVIIIIIIIILILIHFHFLLLLLHSPLLLFLSDDAGKKLSFSSDELARKFDAMKYEALVDMAQIGEHG